MIPTCKEENQNRWYYSCGHNGKPDTMYIQYVKLKRPLIDMLGNNIKRAYEAQIIM